MPLTVRKVIARRAALELRRGDIINLGFGMPDGVASVLAEEGVEDQVTFTVEQGHIGGVPAGGSDFGMCRNPAAMLDAGHQFDWYDGGGLDVAVLSFAELDGAGNVNVSRFGGRLPGVGGFINISQAAQHLVFIGTLVAGGSYAIGDGQPIRVPDDGQPKLVEELEQVSFSADQARAAGQTATYVTERAVFRLSDQGLLLTEIAPGLDLTSDVLDHMQVKPAISPNLMEIDPRCYRPETMGLQLPRRTDEGRP